MVDQSWLDLQVLQVCAKSAYFRIQKADLHCVETICMHIEESVQKLWLETCCDLVVLCIMAI